MRNDRQELEARVQEVTAMLKSACNRDGIKYTADERVSERDAAALVGYEPESMQRMRYSKGGPPFYRRKADDGRVSYRLSDLALWIEYTRQE